MFRVLAAVAIVVGLSGLAAPALAQDAKMKFELYKGKDDQFRWRLKAGNGAVLATAGQGYKAAADARHGIELLQKAGTDDKVTFEVVAESFGLLGDPALRRLATLVHCIDVGGIPVDEAPGFELLVRGLQALHADDDALLAAAIPAFDACYAAFQVPHER